MSLDETNNNPDEYFQGFLVQFEMDTQGTVICRLYLARPRMWTGGSRGEVGGLGAVGVLGEEVQEYEDCVEGRPLLDSKRQ